MIRDSKTKDFSEKPFSGHQYCSRGFTLVEMLVTLTLMSVVATMGVGSVLRVLEANRRAQALQLTMNNINFALENMVRSLRTGTFYHCDILVAGIASPNDCGSGASSIAFEEAGGDTGTTADQVAYRLAGGSIEKSTDGATTFRRVTAPEVTITTLTFRVLGSLPLPDSVQPTIVIHVRGIANGDPDHPAPFDVQAAVTQRILDI